MIISTSSCGSGLQGSLVSELRGRAVGVLEVARPSMWLILALAPRQTARGGKRTSTSPWEEHNYQKRLPIVLTTVPDTQYIGLFE